MSVKRMNYIELSKFLTNKGLSDTGKKSITENEITGQMLFEFCEEDIQDAFSVFRDRFTIRKVLREQKSTENQSSSVVSPNRPSLPSANHQALPSLPSANHQVLSSQQYKHCDLNKQSSNSFSNKPVSSSNQQNNVYSHQHHQPTRGVISLVSSEPERSSPMKTQVNPAFMSPSRTVSSPPIRREETQSRRQSIELMNEKVSSTDEYSPHRDRKVIERVDDSQLNIYDSAVDALVSLSKHIGSDSNLQQRTGSTEFRKDPKSHSPSTCSKTASTNSSNIIHQNQIQLYQMPSASSIYGLNYDCTYAWSVMSSKVKTFTADELLSKRSRYAKPTEAQRLGGILIRNAAHAAGIWKDAPCLHEINVPQKKEFFKFIVSLAPQLSASQNTIFTRLREALQNRRKYLLDKKLGKVQARRKRGSSDLSIEIADSGSFVDLSGLPDDFEDESMDSSADDDVKFRMNNEEIQIKTEAIVKKE
ncbi:uncharacterized protein LOC134683171 [Mytilus trossulus]|uniref:uncharacterized protein LOC134683171 n=1 Tax=Mytilus trossulus TaxID=6551 RepID=UPI0030060AE0